MIEALRTRTTAAVARTRYPRTVLFLVLAVIYTATASYRIISIDVGAAEGPAWALATRGTLDLSTVPHHDLQWYFEHDGGLYSDRFPGAILFLVPAYWVAAQLGFDGFTLVPGAVTAALFTAGAVVLLREAFTAVLASEKQVWIATGFVALGTGTWSIAANAPWSHTLDLFLIAAALALFARDRLAWAGLVLGLSVTSRPTMGVAIASLGVTLGLLRRSWKPTALIAVTALPGVLALITYNGLMFDRWGVSNGHELGGEIQLRLADLPANVVGALFSPSKGLLLFYPILLLALFSMRAAWRGATAWERAAAAGGLAVLVTQLALNRYSGGDTFWGPRLVIEPLALAAPLLARAVAAYAEARGPFLVRWMLAAGLVLHGVAAVILPY